MKKFNHHETPLFSTLRNHASSNPIPFHVPGHKKGRGMDAEFSEFIGPHALSIDTTNISALDDLHSPTNFIKQAQEMAADAFSAEQTLFSIQGTSSAIMIMILSVCKRGDKLIVPRNVHKSVLSAIILGGIHPIFITPEIDPDWGIAHGIHPEDVEQAIRTHPDAKAVLLLNPTYFGVTSNIRRIVHIAHQHRIPVIVDEAHGTFLHFHEALPTSAMEAGADLSATSVHKLGGALSQGSILCFQSKLIDFHQVVVSFNLLTTTSPSYIILASIDTARRYLALYGRQEIDRVLHLTNDARYQINQIPGLSCLSKDDLKSEASFDIDEVRLVVNVRKLGITGQQADEWLHRHHQIDIELSDLYNLLCIVSTGDSKESITYLVQAFQSLSQQYDSKRDFTESTVKTHPTCELALLPQDAYYRPKVSIPLDQSIGEVVAENVIFFPPGIPILLPGERITKEIIFYIKENIQSGAKVIGPKDPSLQTIQVVSKHLNGMSY
jgi:arginine/lysine/ornithine decarboxylase